MSNPEIIFHEPQKTDDGESHLWKAKVRTVRTELPGFLVVLISLLILVYFSYEDSFSVNMLGLALLFAGLSVSWNIIGGLAGQFSMAHSVFFAIGAFTAANLFIRFDVSPWISLIPAASLGALFGCLISWPVFRLKGPFFAIATMASTEVALALAMYFDNLTGGARGLAVPFRAGFSNMIFAHRWAYALLMLGYCALTILVMIMVVRSRLGYQLQAVRDNENAALASGINVIGSKLKGVVISAALTSVGGAVFAMYVRVIDPASLFSLFDIGVKIALIAMIGGIGTIYGPLLGALLIVPLDLWLRAYIGSKVPGGNLIVLGGILILSALFLKQGIYGAIKSFFDNLKRRTA